MFDELDNKNSVETSPASPAPLTGKATEPTFNSAPMTPTQRKSTEDIFAEVDDLEKPEVFQAKSPTPPAEDDSEQTGGSSGQSKKFFILGSIIIGLVVIFVGGYLVYAKFFRTAITSQPSATQEQQTKNEQPPAQTTANPEQNINNPAENIPAAPTANEVTGQAIDSDQDGLSDEEEKSLGTKPNSPDSDSDGLFDREEVKVYGTDPLNPDTDGDGYKDGDEVKNGYNPKGPGKLYEIKQ